MYFVDLIILKTIGNQHNAKIKLVKKHNQNKR
jgi:hypothetical protein